MTTNTNNEVETGSFFASSIYKISKPEFLSSALEVFDEQIDIVKKEKELDELHPHYMTRTFLDDRLKDFNYFVLNTAWTILDTQGYKMDDRVTYFQSLWGQEHYKYSSMEQHAHAEDTQIVGFYFLECPEKASSLILHDPRPAKCQINLPQKDGANITDSSVMVNFQPTAGSLWFTNSWLPHSFSRHGSNEPLKFIHFNISVKQDISQPYAHQAGSEVEII